MLNLIKKAYYMMFDNSPNNFDKIKQNADVDGFLRNAGLITEQYYTLKNTYSKIVNNIANKEFVVINKYKQFIDEVYIHCNPYNNLINQVILTNLMEKFKMALNKIKSKNNDEIKNQILLEEVETLLEDTVDKTKYFLNKEREEIYLQFNQLQKYYSWKTRFLSWIKFIMIYGIIIFLIKNLVNGIVYLNTPTEFFRFLRFHLWY